MTRQVGLRLIACIAYPLGKQPPLYRLLVQHGFEQVDAGIGPDRYAYRATERGRGPASLLFTDSRKLATQPALRLVKRAADELADLGQEALEAA